MNAINEKIITIGGAAVLGAFFLGISPAEASGHCTFTETAGKVVVRPAEVHGAMGNIRIRWSDGGQTSFLHIQDGLFRDDGNNFWELKEPHGAHLQMRRMDGASMSCFTPS